MLEWINRPNLLVEDFRATAAFRSLIRSIAPDTPISFRSSRARSGGMADGLVIPAAENTVNAVSVSASWSEASQLVRNEL